MQAIWFAIFSHVIFADFDVYFEWQCYKANALQASCLHYNSIAHAEGWFPLAHKHKPIYTDAVRC